MLEPRREEQTKYQTVEDVLAKVKSDKRLTSVLPVAIYTEGDGSCGSQRTPKRDHAKEYYN